MSAQVILDNRQEGYFQERKHLSCPADGIEAEILISNKEHLFRMTLLQGQGFIEVLAKVVADGGQVPTESLATPRDVHPGLHESPWVAEEEDDLDVAVLLEEPPDGLESEADGLDHLDRINRTCLEIQKRT